MGNEGTTIIMVTYTTYLVAKYVEDVLLMNKGKIVFRGKIRDLFCQLDSINTKAIEKPEILKTCEFLKESGYPDIPSVLITDEIINGLREECLYE